MAKDQIIDGPAVAAQILSRLPLSEQAQLVSSLREQSPQAAASIVAKLRDFNHLAHLQAPTLQHLLHEVPNRDLAISLKTAGEPVKRRLLENVSESKLRMVEDDYDSLPPMKVIDVEAAQQRILKRLEELYPDEESSSQERKPLKPRLA